MAAERACPELIVDEDPWRSSSGRLGYAHVRVWRAAADQVTVVISGPYAERRLAELIADLRAEYPEDTVEFYFHRPMDWAALGCYAALTVDADGPVVQTHLPGDTVAARLGPAFYATEDPDDYSTVYGGA